MQGITDGSSYGDLVILFPFRLFLPLNKSIVTPTVTPPKTVATAWHTGQNSLKSIPSTSTWKSRQGSYFDINELGHFENALCL